jgi:hypothetical protein
MSAAGSVPRQQRGEDVAAEENLLADRRDDTGQPGAQHEQQRPFVGAELFEQLLLARVEHFRPDHAEHDEHDDQQDHERARRPPADGRRAQPELPGAHDAPAEPRAVDGGEHEGEVLHHGVGDRQARRRVRAGQLDPQSQRGKIHDKGADGRQHEPADERQQGAPRRPARVGRALRLRGRSLELLCPLGRALVYATQCHVANCAVKKAIRKAEAAIAGPRRRACSLSHAAKAIASGNSTTRKRGSDISGWELTG